MSAGVLITICAIVALAGFGQSVAGFGFSLLAVPPLGLLIDPKDAVAIALTLLVANSALMAWGERGHIDGAAVRSLMLGAAPGLPLGLLVLDVVPADGLRIAIALAVAISVIVLWSGFTLSHSNRAVELSAGFATGLLTTSLTTNGPPIVLALQARQLQSHQFRPTSSAVLGATSAVGAVLFAVTGRLHGDVRQAILIAIPGLVVGWSVGVVARRRVPEPMFRGVVLGLLAIAAIATVIGVIA
jgi:uncharacterized membrane protein YfcA